jgi:hypothetical protein
MVRPSRTSWVALLGSLVLAALSGLVGIQLSGGSTETRLFILGYAGLSAGHGLSMVRRQWRARRGAVSSSPLAFGALLHLGVWAFSTVFLFVNGIDPPQGGLVVSVVLFGQGLICLTAFRQASGRRRPNRRGFVVSMVQLVVLVALATWTLVTTRESYSAFLAVPFVAAPLLLHAAASTLLLLTGFPKRHPWLPRLAQGLFALYYALLLSFCVWVALNEGWSAPLARIAVVAGVCLVLAGQLTRRRPWSEDASPPRS